MVQLIIKKFFARITPLLPVLLVACSAVAPVEQADDPRIAKLVVGMDQCLANQAQANKQLKIQ